MFRWRASDAVLGLLVGLLIFTIWGGVLPQGEGIQPYGGDFLQFYTAGHVVNLGAADRLYEQDYFRGLQASMKEDPLYSMYPPMMALVMAPLARLPYERAVQTWWVLQALCFAGAGWMLYRMMPIARPWRINALVALTATFPVWVAVRIGHLSPVLLVTLVGGIALHCRDKRVWAGVVLSALALKPQLIVGIVLWMSLRRDVRTLAGLAVGGVLQAAAVSVFLGPNLLLNYLHAMPEIAAVTRMFRYSAVFEQSFAGIVDNLLWLRHGGKNPCVVPMRIAHILTAGAAAVLLARITWSGRPWSAGQRPLYVRQYEYAGGVLFLLLLPPYLLVYDLTLLAAPLALLWSSPAWRTGIVLYATVTIAFAAIYLWTGFSVVGVAALWTLFHLAVALEPLRSPRPKTSVSREVAHTI